MSPREIRDGDPASSLQARELEGDFMQKIIDLAHLQRWKVYHTRDSRGSEEGFPDLVLVRPPRLIFAEIKKENGVLTLAQTEWLDDLGRSVRVVSEVWRPADWNHIDATLR